MFLKKLLLVSVAIAALIPTAWADDVVASVDDGNYYLYNESTETFLSRGASWSTQAVVDNYGIPFELTTSDNVSTLKFLDNSCYLFRTSDNNVYGDGASTNDVGMKLYQVNDGVVLYNVASAMYITHTGNTLSLTQESSSADVWKFVSNEERKKIVATKELNLINTAFKSAGVENITSVDDLSTALENAGLLGKDVTNCIENSDFNSTDNWTWSESRSWSDNNARAVSNNVYEFWNMTGVLSQTVTVKNEGLYKITFQGFQRNGTYANCATIGDKGYVLGINTIKANESYALIPDWYSDGSHVKEPNSPSAARTYFNNGKYQTELYVYVGSDKTLNLSANLANYVWDAWTTLGGFKLDYYTSSLDDIKPAYETAVNTATTLKEKVMNTEVLETLKSVLETYGSVSSEAAKDYVKAINALNEANESAQLSVDAYANAASQIEYIETLLSNTNVYTAETKAALDDEISAAKATYNNGAYTNQEANALNFTSTAAKMVFSTWSGNNKTGNLQVNTWSTEGNTDGSNFKVPFVEYYLGSSTLDDATLTSKMTDLIDGEYKVSVEIRMQKKTETLKGVSLSVNDGTAVDFVESEAKAYDNSLYIETLEATGNVIGGILNTQINVESTNIGWLSFRNVKYERIGDLADEVYKETYETAVAKAKSYTEDTMQPAVWKQLQSAITEYENTTSDYKTAASALTQVNDLADQSVAVTALGVEDVLKLMAEEVATTNVYTQDALDTYYNNPLKAFNDGTMTVAEASALKSPYANTGKTGAVASFLLSAWDVTSLDGDYYINTWSTEGNTDGSNFKVPFYEYWTTNANTIGAKTLTATVTGLESGKTYSIKAWTRVRRTDNNTKEPYGITLQATGGSPVNVCAGTQVGTSQLYLDYFSVSGVADANGTLEIQYVVASDNNISWLSFQKVTIREAADAEKVTELRNSVEALKAARPTGFETGDYAPYNNIDAFAKLSKAETAAGEKTKLTTMSTSDYENANELYEAAKSATWTVNTEELNAVYDGTFFNAGNDAAPFGWRMTNSTLGGGSHARVLIDDRLSVLNETNSGFYARFTESSGNSSRGSMYYYGDTEGYTMPLKAGRLYYVKLDVGGWGSSEHTLNVGIPESSVSLKTASDIANGGTELNHVYKVFTVSKDGNYTIYLQSPGPDTNVHNVIVSNIELKSIAEKETRTTSLDGFGTICLPYDFTVEDATLYEIKEVEAVSVTLNKVEGDGVAGTAYIYQATGSDGVTFSYKQGDLISTPTEGTLTGVFESTNVATGHYVLQNQGDGEQFYKVADGSTITLNPFRAYLTASETASEEASALRISFENTTTGVEAVKALTDGEAQIYDLNGRKLSKLRKGINIVNGVKVIVKE